MEDVRESTAGSATGTEVPKQQQDVSQPPPRRATGVTINEPIGAPRSAAAPAPLGKGKKKASEPTLESSDENDMPVERAFDLYTKSASKKKSHRRQSGEGCSNPPVKKSRTDDPPAPTPTKETTPRPAPSREATPPTPTNPDPPSPVKQTPPPAPVDPTPPASTVQQSAGRREEASGDDLTGVGVLTLTSGWRFLRTQNAQFEKRLSDHLSAAEARYTEKLKAAEASYVEHLEAVKAKQIEALRDAEVKHTKALKEAEAKHLEALQYKEVSLNNYREAHKLQDELEISRKEVAALEEQNARNLEDYEGASFECFYLFWKNNPNSNFSYLLEHIKEAELARCVTRLEEETIPRSPEISLAIGIEGAREEAGDAVDQQQQKSPQDAPTTS
ncbi:uncharacterized protein LOC133779208 [Humulus lupulus]|uniref:uncharacterized protein LOC133779208 n=1 Tax=Humulus lupulus TaxID=3486 RepID=UPI002B40F28A|nr:uncharacterized protein LOC133779208 [Humulus lupulus]